jgi:hypothetical protein
MANVEGLDTSGEGVTPRLFLHHLLTWISPSADHVSGRGETFEARGQYWDVGTATSGGPFSGFSVFGALDSSETIRCACGRRTEAPSEVSHPYFRIDSCISSSRTRAWIDYSITSLMMPSRNSGGRKVKVQWLLLSILLTRNQSPDIGRVRSRPPSFPISFRQRQTRSTCGLD